MTVRKWVPDDPKDDRWYVRIYVSPGVQYNEMIHAPSEREANRYHDEKKVELRRGQLVAGPNRNKTVKEIVQDLLAVDKDLRYSSRRKYERTCTKYIYPPRRPEPGHDAGIGDVRIRDFQNDHLALVRYFNGVEARAGRSQRIIVEMLVRRALRAALRDGIISRNPLDGVKTAVQDSRPAYQPEMIQMRKVVDRLRCSPGVPDARQEQFVACVVAMVGLGPRVGELLAISDDDVDFDRRIVTVRRQILKGKVYYDKPKSESGEREIPAPRFVLDTIERWMEVSPPEPVTAPWGSPYGELQTHNLIFHSLHRPRSRLSHEVLWKEVRESGAAVGVAGKLTPHGVRGLYTSVLHDGGVPQAVIDEVTGHKRAGSVTYTVYTKAMARGLSMVRDVIEREWALAQEPDDGEPGRRPLLRVVN